MLGTRPVVLLIATSLALGACGEDRAGGDDSERPGDPAATEVVATEYRLDPQVAHVARAGSVAIRLVDEGRRPHALAVEGPTGERRTPTVRPGERATLRLALPEGTYKWYCPLRDHEQRGMTGQLKVGAG